MTDVLHVIGVCHNPAGWKTRTELARKFVGHMQSTPGVELHLVEIVREGQPHLHSPKLALRSNTCAWLKESAINVAVRSMPADWKYVAWVDADMTFRRPRWTQAVVDTLAAGKCDLLQPWSHCVNRGPRGEMIQVMTSWGYDRRTGQPGGAWACTREYWERWGGLPDWCIVGGGDAVALLGALGEADGRLLKLATPAFRERCLEWQTRAKGARVGHLAGAIEHGWHGSRTDRGYVKRWGILRDHGFDPYVHVGHDDQGLIYIVDNPGLDAALRGYMKSRQEDGRPG